MKISLAMIKLRYMGLIRLFSLLLLLLCSMFVGWYFGYIAGVKNQIYFDAVARVIYMKKDYHRQKKKLRTY